MHSGEFSPKEGEKILSREKITESTARSIAEAFESLGCKLESQNTCEDGRITIIIDTFDKGNIEIDVLSEDRPEILVKNYNPYHEEELRQMLDILKRKGVVASCILLKKGEKYPIEESPENPPILPPSAKELSPEELQLIVSKTEQPTITEIFPDWPSVGSRGHRTELGIINGELIYCDSEIAIFRTPQGMIKIPFSEILDPFGRPYEKREKGTKQKEEQPPEIKHIEI
ncbi:MAG: hypothetical protein WC242_02830 [Candidatus Paceibacterota bacterium]|jgi:hypothetical protein